jgi:hypothetical protein
MSKQTAVEWLAENYLPLKRGIELEHENTVKVVQQAKAMEKEQIIDSLHYFGIERAEQYYKETYNK